jgi:hypothetical protein
MRVAEMYLIAAEGYARTGTNDDLARTRLYDLQSTRDPKYKKSTLSGDALIEAILYARRIELWGEFGRVYDIKRLRQGFVRTAEMGHPAAALLQNLKVNDPETFDWVLTIPQAEIDANPYMVQNPVGSEAGDGQGDDPALTPKVEE